MIVGRQAEAENNLQQAANAYASALKLDADYLAARQASQQLAARVDKLEFQKDMSLALQNIDNGQLAAANDALMRADKIYPNHPAVSDTKSRLATAGREYTLNRLRRQAAQAADREDWPAATEYYRKALSIDPQAAFALSGPATFTTQALPGRSRSALFRRTTG
jgi:tetratricopeptide (TPR) repeat protein